MGGTRQYFTQQAPVLETSFCVSHRNRSCSKEGNSSSLWSIPYVSLSFPIGSSIGGFRRHCVRDYYCESTTSSGAHFSSELLWSNVIWWQHRLTDRIWLNWETGILAGEIVNVSGSPPHLFLREDRVSGGVVSGSFAVSRGSSEIYGGARHYGIDRYSPLVWIGLRKEISADRRGRVELVYETARSSCSEDSDFPEFHFGMEEKVSEAVWVRYGFAVVQAPTLFCLTLGCGVSREMLSLDTAVASYLLENENALQLMIGISTRL